LTNAIHLNSSLTIVNDYEEIPRMTGWLCAELERLGASAEVQYKFDFSANELVTNVISYAYADAARHEITLNLWADEGKIYLEIVDDGVPFNPLEKPAQAQPETLEDAAIGGLGIDLVRHYMDELEYRRSASQNHLILGLQFAGG